MIYHFVPFDMQYWNLILHQYKWCTASRWKSRMDVDFTKISANVSRSVLCPILSLPFPQLYCTKVERHKRNICLPNLLFYSQLWYGCLKSVDLKSSGRKSLAQVKIGFGKKRRVCWGCKWVAEGTWQRWLRETSRVVKSFDMILKCGGIPRAIFRLGKAVGTKSLCCSVSLV